MTSGASTQIKVSENDGLENIIAVEVLGQGQILHILSIYLTKFPKIIKNYLKIWGIKQLKG